MPIRSAAKAIIIEQNQLLCIRYHDIRGTHYGLPGGGQEPQESLREAVIRECQEEIDCVVVPHELCAVYEFIGQRHAIFEKHRRFHQINHFFRCTLSPGSQPANGVGADLTQQGVEWVPLHLLTQVYFDPAELVPRLLALAQHPTLDDILVEG